MVYDREKIGMQRHRGLFLSIAVLLLAGSGCQSLPPFNWNWINTSAAWQEWSDDDKYMTTWHEKYGSLVDLRRAADGMARNEQVAHATALSAQIKEEPVPVVRREMVRALAAFPVVEAELGLETALADEDIDIRVAACKAWAKRKSEKAVTLLLNTIRSDTETDVRVAALQGLSHFQGQEVYAELTKALADREPAIQFAGIQGLRKLTGEDWGEDPEVWIAWTKGASPEVIHDGQESLSESINPANLFR